MLRCWWWSTQSKSGHSSRGTHTRILYTRFTFTLSFKMFSTPSISSSHSGGETRKTPEFNLIDSLRMTENIQKEEKFSPTDTETLFSSEHHHRRLGAGWCNQQTSGESLGNRTEKRDWTFEWNQVEPSPATGASAGMIAILLSVFSFFFFFILDGCLLLQNKGTSESKPKQKRKRKPIEMIWSKFSSALQSKGTQWDHCTF